MDRAHQCGRWQVAGGSGSWHVAGAYIVDVICRAAPSPHLSFSLALSLSLVVCSALSKHVTGMPRLRDVWARTGSSDTWNETEWNGMEWNKLDWPGLAWTGHRLYRVRRSVEGRRVTFAAGNGNGGSDGYAAAAYNGNGNGNSAKCLHGRRCGSSANICVTCLTKK